MLSFNNYIPLKYIKEFSKEFNYIDTIFKFLYLVKIAQNKKNRIAYYTYCCFVSTLTSIEHRSYATGIYNYFTKKSLTLEKIRLKMFKTVHPDDLLEELKLRFFNRPHINLKQLKFKLFKPRRDNLERINLNLFKIMPDNIVFNGLECYYNNMFIDSFRSVDFFNKSKEYVYLLPYKNYILKVEFTMYIILWFHIERVRQRKYSEYVKMHPKINYYQNWNIRSLYSQAPPQQLLGDQFHQLTWFRMWLLEIKKEKFYILLTQAKTKLRVIIPNSISDSLQKLYKQKLNFKVLKIVSKMDFFINKKNSNTVKFIRKSISLRWGIETCHTLTKYHHWFPNQVRLDFNYYWQCYYMCVTSWHIYYKRIKIDQNDRHLKLFTEFVKQDDIQNYIFLKQFNLKVDFSNFYKYSCAKLPYNFLKIIICTAVTKLSVLIYWSTVHWRLKMERTFQRNLTLDISFINALRKYTIFQSYYKVNNKMFDLLFLQTQYDYWRSWNPDLVYLISDGRLLNKYIHTCMYVDLNFLTNYNNLFPKIIDIWKNLNIYNKTLKRIKQPKSTPYVFKKFKNVMRELKRRKRRAKTVIRPKRVKSLYSIQTNKTTPFMLYDILMTVYIQIFIQSWEYAFISFFCFYNKSSIVFENYYSQLEGNKLHILFQTQMITRRYIDNYKTTYSEYRRALFIDNNKALIKGTSIHGINPLRLEDWKVHANWMRIIGLSAAQLPFYYTETYKDEKGLEKQDWWLYMKNLREKRKKIRINMVKTRLYKLY